MAPYLNAKRTISLVSRVLTTLDFLGYIPGSISLVSRVLTTLDFLGYVPVLLLISWMATAVNMTTTITLLAHK